MSVSCEIFPHPDLSPDQCKLLGKRIEEWIYDRPSTRSSVSFGLKDLRDGELPQPFYVQRLMGIEGRTLPEEMVGKPGTPVVRTLSQGERQKFREELGEKANLRFISVTILNPEARDRKAIVANLERRIASDLVSEILIEGVTWRDSFDFDATL